jgi:hypothetical protein
MLIIVPAILRVCDAYLLMLLSVASISYNTPVCAREGRSFLWVKRIAKEVFVRPSLTESMKLYGRRATSRSGSALIRLRQNIESDRCASLRV